MSDSIYTMPFAHFTSSRAGTGSKRTVVTIPAKKYPVWIRVIRCTASEPIETCIYNISNPLVTPITESSEEVAGINCTQGDENGGVVFYQSFTGYRGDSNMGFLGTPGFLETASAAGVMLSLPDKTIIPPFCGIAVSGTGTNRALAVAAVGYEIRFSYEIDGDGIPVPRRTRR